MIETKDPSPTSTSALAAHLEAIVEWEPPSDGLSPEGEDADFLRGFMTLDPAKSGGFDWTAFGYGSPCPEGWAPTRQKAKSAACSAMAESFSKAAAAHGLVITVVERAPE